MAVPLLFSSFSLAKFSIFCTVQSGAVMSGRSSFEYDDGCVGGLADKPVFGSAGAHQNHRHYNMFITFLSLKLLCVCFWKDRL